MIIATAGHVDHGKTTLLQALTGINADRLPEEQKRGMTIDLGYAYWSQPDGRIIGFIDVPGHEKFLANMLAGIGGIDHAMLVVACDDGVMAQTREHLALLRLAGQPTLSVVLTKADRVSLERIDQVKQQVQDLLGTASVPLFVTAAAKQQGIAPLAHYLSQLTALPHARERRFRLAIDRVFSIKGAGLVVTGTALGGQVKLGDTLWLTGAEKSIRVRGLHAQNQKVTQAQAGQRIALNIAGDIEKSHISRGDWLLTTQPTQAVERPIVELQCLEDVKHWQPVHIHHAARHITGRVSLLAGSFAELILDTPLWLAANDRLILRDISARQTLGSARCLVLHPPRRGKRQGTFLDWLQQLSQTQSDQQALITELQRSAVSQADFSWARQLSCQGMADLLTKGDNFQAADWLINSQTLRIWQQRLLSCLAEYHQAHDDQPGPSRERLTRIALPQEPEKLVLAVIESLRATGQVHSHQGWLHLPDHQPAFSADQQRLWQQVALLLGNQAWWVRDLAQHTGHEEHTLRILLRSAAQQGKAIAIVKDRYYDYHQIVHMAEVIRLHAAHQEWISAADFRNSLGVGRKLAVQILEFFDRVGFTRRRGNSHILRDNTLFTLSSAPPD